MLQRIARGFFVVTCALAVVMIASVTAPGTAGVEAQDSALSDVQEGLSEYKKGNWESAIEKFDAALAANPGDEEARRIRDEIGAELALDMVQNNLRDTGLKGRYSRFGKWVMAGLKDSPFQGRQNAPAQIASFVDAYMSDSDIARNMQRARNIRNHYGDFAVPHIQHNYMHSDNADYRSRSRVLLKSLGAQAVTAIIQCFYSPHTYDRQVAAYALGDIGDARALPVLTKHFQDENEEETVRKACGDAIQWIRADNPEQDRKVTDAGDLFFLQAEGYYRNNAAGRFYRNRLVGSNYQGHLPVVMYDVTRSYTVWKWIDEKEGGDESPLTPQEVPLWAYADIVAEESALQALRVGVAGGNRSFVQDTQALLACIHTHMYTEARNRYYTGGETEKEFIENLLGEDGFVPQRHGLGLAAASGTTVLYAALERALADGYPTVAVALCNELARLGDSAPVGKPQGAALRRALVDPDRAVRYAAAQALITLGAETSFGYSSEVERQATTALQESQARSVLVIVEDESLRNAYLRTLDGLGINSTGARTLEEGADLAMQGPPWDAIIIEGALAVAPVFVFELPAMAGAASRPERQEPIFHLLSDDIRTQDIPVLIAVQDSELDQRRSTLDDLGVDDQRFIKYSPEYAVDGESLQATLEFTWDRNKEDAKGKTNEMVVGLADAIGRLNPKATRYNVDALLVALSGGLRLEGRSSEAREAICNAIGDLAAYSGNRVGAQWMRENIVPNLLDTINADETSLVDRPSVKGAAAYALGEVYKNHRGAWDEDGFNALKDMLRLKYDLSSIQDDNAREDMKLEVERARNAAGEAIGKSPLTPEQNLALLEAQQVNPHHPHPETRSAD